VHENTGWAKYWPILKILSPLQSPENLQLTSNVSLHYFVKCLCQKTSVFCAMWRIVND